MVRRLGVLVAGGRGRRLGLGVPKALVTVGGRTLLERALATLGAVCDEVVVAAPASLELPVDAAVRAFDPSGAEGPLAGVVAGLGARPHQTAIVLGVDFPFMRSAVLATLLDRLAEAAALMPAPGGVPQPLAAACGSAAQAGLAAALANGERSITRAMLALPARLVDADTLAAWGIDPRDFFNLNLAADLAWAERQSLGIASGGRP